MWATALRRAQGRMPADRVLSAALLLQLLPLLLLARVVTVDGPAHLAGAAVLLSYDDPGRDVLRRLYEVDLRPVPNMLTTLVLAGLLHLTGPDVAERLLVGAYVVLLTLGLRYALRGVHVQAGWLAVAALPFAGNYLYYYGFYNFCLSLSLTLFVLGLALRRRDGWSGQAVAGLSVLLVLAWFAHLLPLLIAGLFVAVLAVLRALPARRTGGALRAVRTHVLAPALAALPILLLTASFLASPAAERGTPVRRSAADLVLGLATLGRPLAVYSRYEYLPATAVALTLVALVVVARRSGRPSSPERQALACTAALCTVLYLASPDRYGPDYGFLNDRLSLFPPLLLLLWTAGPVPDPRFRRLVVGALLSAAVLLAGLRVPTEIRYQRDVAEMLSVAAKIPQGSTMLSLQLWRDPAVGGPVGNQFRDPLRHQAGRLAVLLDGVDVGHYEATLDYFPTRFRAGNDLRRRIDPSLTGLNRIPPAIDLAAGSEDIDAVLVIGREQAGPALLARPDTQRLLRDLAADYERTAVSERSGLVEVWTRR
ncbi:MAG: hypothetical protein KY451_15765 [Actinobacteria bacterium]|nr:hypothetical protein [Actinomycetota bacterium]